ASGKSGVHTPKPTESACAMKGVNSSPAIMINRLLWIIPYDNSNAAANVRPTYDGVTWLACHSSASTSTDGSTIGIVTDVIGSDDTTARRSRDVNVCFRGSKNGASVSASMNRF